MVEKTIAFYKANGKEKALEEFSKPKRQFTKGNRYICAYHPKGTIIAQGGDLKPVGEDFTNVQEPDGKYFAREFIKIGPKRGWVDYKRMNNAMKKADTKTTYLKRIDYVIIGCGTYNNRISAQLPGTVNR